MYICYWYSCYSNTPSRLPARSSVVVNHLIAIWSHTIEYSFPTIADLVLSYSVLVMYTHLSMQFVEYYSK